mmetsp:Transcript_33252/g.80386  ORF Transcript_33252/g.80386 Transcript_33252/m.80386 type:complete len:229 (+) Transcript_33252:3164-3850(+)
MIVDWKHAFYHLAHRDDGGDDDHSHDYYCHHFGRIFSYLLHVDHYYDRSLALYPIARLGRVCDQENNPDYYYRGHPDDDVRIDDPYCSDDRHHGHCSLVADNLDPDFCCDDDHLCDDSHLHADHRHRCDGVDHPCDPGDTLDHHYFFCHHHHCQNHYYYSMDFSIEIFVWRIADSFSCAFSCHSFFDVCDYHHHHRRHLCVVVCDPSFDSIFAAAPHPPPRRHAFSSK